MLYLIVGLTAISIAACHLIARRKGLSVGFWVAMGLLLGPLALPFLLVAPSNPDQSAQDTDAC